MVKFLNVFSRKAQSNTKEQNVYIRDLFKSFLNATKHLPDNVFINKRNGRFNIALIEAVFSAACRKIFEKRELADGQLELEQIQNLETDEEFVSAATVTTTSTANVKRRLQRGYSLVKPL